MKGQHILFLAQYLCLQKIFLRRLVVLYLIGDDFVLWLPRRRGLGELLRGPSLYRLDNYLLYELGFVLLLILLDWEYTDIRIV